MKFFLNGDGALDEKLRKIFKIQKLMHVENETVYPIIAMNI